MPYVTQDIRNDLKYITKAFKLRVQIIFESNSSDMIVKNLASDFISIIKQSYYMESYASYNEAIGLLSCIRLEFLRRNPDYSPITMGARVYELREGFRLINETGSEFGCTDNRVRAGIYNYIISSALMQPEISANRYNKVLIDKALHIAINHYYSTTVADYENIKMKQNGDIIDRH